MMEYRQHEQPGCGGCLLFAVLFLLLIGGMPLLFDVLGALLLTGLFLVLAVVTAFWAFTYYIKRQISRYERSQTETHNTFVTLLVNILIKISQVDGVITREEINTINNFFRYHLKYSHAQLLWVKEIIKEARQSTVSLETLLAEFKSVFTYEPRLILIELIYQVIFSQEPVADSALELARKIADYLEISPYDLQAIQSKYMARFRHAVAEGDRYYEILGLANGAGFEEIKTAYRKLSMKYHPDKVGHLGEEFRKVAEEKMKELNVAYQWLKKKFQ